MLTSQVQGRKVWKRQRNPIKKKHTKMRTKRFKEKERVFILLEFSSNTKSLTVNDLLKKLLHTVGLIGPFKLPRAPPHTHGDMSQRHYRVGTTPFGMAMDSNLLCY